MASGHTANRTAHAQPMHPINLAPAGNFRTSIVCHLLAEWLQHIHQYSENAALDIHQLLLDLRASSLSFLDTGTEDELHGLEPIGIYAPETATRPFLLVKVDNNRSLPDLPFQFQTETCIALRYHRDKTQWMPLNATRTTTVRIHASTPPLLSFPSGLIAILSPEDPHPHLAPILPSAAIAARGGITDVSISPLILDAAIQDPLLARLLSPDQLQHLRSKPITLQCHLRPEDSHDGPQLYLVWEVVLETPNVSRHLSLKRNGLWRQDSFDINTAIHQFVVETYRHYAQLFQLRQVCEQAGHLWNPENQSTGDSRDFSFLWSWADRNSIRIIFKNTPPPYRRLDVRAYHCTLTQETPDAAFDRIQTLLHKVRAVLTEHTASQLAC